MRSARIVFLGATNLGWKCCQTLIEIGGNVVGLFTVPKQFPISWSPSLVTNVLYRDFSDIARENDIPLVSLQGRMGDTQNVQALRDLRPDLIVAVGWYHMIPRVWRDSSALGAVGIHGSLLPRYRGGAPLVWAVINGETRSGVSLFRLEDGVDTGALVAQKSFEIEEGESIGDLLVKSEESSVALIRENARALSDGCVEWTRQDESQATTYPQRRAEDGLLDWTKHSAQSAYNWIRAQSEPYPGAFTFMGDKKILLWKAKPVSSTISPVIAPPGTVLPSDSPSGFRVVCADHRPIEVVIVGHEGRRQNGVDLFKSVGGNCYRLGVARAE